MEGVLSSATGCCCSGYYQRCFVNWILQLAVVCFTMFTNQNSFYSFASDRSRLNDLQDYCQLETFHAECEESEVLYFSVARYGRMRLDGRCVKRDWGHIGCAADVLPHLDRICSGRRSCEFPVADLNGNQPCPADLAPFLEVKYECVPVMTEDSIKCSSQVPIVLTAQTGVLASVVAMDTSRGSSDCPWRIQVLPGQQINITLINFARTGLQNDWGKIPTPGSGPRPKICYQLATIKERQFSRTLTECEEGPRESHAYTSTSDSVEIEMIVAKILKVYFLLRYQAIGCPNPATTPGMWLRREGDYAVVRCNATGTTWHMRCKGSIWEGQGQMENCSQSTSVNSAVAAADGWNVGQMFAGDAFPYSILIVVSVGVALGVFIGGVLLVCAARYVRRRQETMIPSEDYFPDLYNQQAPDSGKTLVLSCDAMTPTTQEMIDASAESLRPLQPSTILSIADPTDSSNDYVPRCPCSSSATAVYDSFPLRQTSAGSLLNPRSGFTIQTPLSSRFCTMRGAAAPLYESPTRYEQQQQPPHSTS